MRYILVTLSMAVAGLFLMISPAPAHASAVTTSACSIDSPPQNCSGLYALKVSVAVPHGAYVFVPDPGCMNDSAGALHNVVQAAVAAGVPELAMFSGSISDLATPMIAGQLAQHGGFISQHLSPYAKNGAMCAPVVAVVPANATVVGFRLAAQDNVGLSSCNAGSDCGIGWSKFQAEPVVDKSAGMQTVMAMFMNWSHNRDRTAFMTVFYKLPAGQVPLTQM